MAYDLPDEITVSGDANVRTITLNRPEHRNAANFALHEGLADIWRQVRADKEVHAVVLTGAGPAFCAGGDMDLLQRTAEDPAFRYDAMATARRIVTEMIGFPLPIVAAVNGPAVGLGCSLAVLCDIVLMAETSYLADPHVTIGVVAADGGTLYWPALTSLLRAKEYLFTGDRIPAEEAERIGLANRVVADDQLLAEAHRLAERLAEQPAQALRDTKRALNLHLSRTVNNALDFAFAAESETFGLPDFQASLAAHRARFQGSSDSGVR